MEVFEVYVELAHEATKEIEGGRLVQYLGTSDSVSDSESEIINQKIQT